MGLQSSLPLLEGAKDSHGNTVRTVLQQEGQRSGATCHHTQTHKSDCFSVFRDLPGQSKNLGL